MTKQIEAPKVPRVYMRELAQRLDRSSGTIRGWEREGALPKSLRSRRDDKGWRYWNEPQVDRILEWMRRNGMAPGKGLSGFKPSVDQVQGMLKQLRQPRNIVPEDCPHCGKSVKNLSAHVRFAHPQAA